MQLFISFITSMLLIPVLLGSITDELFVIRFNELSPETVTEFTASKYDVASYKPGHFLDLVVDNKLYKEILHQGYNVEITQTESQLKENMITGRDLDGYRTYEDVLMELQQLEIDYPDLCKLYDIGDSQGKIYSDEGNSFYDDYYHEIWALKLSDNVNEEEDEPGVFYLGEHHARETISLEVTMDILNYLIYYYGTDPTITSNVNNTEIWFIPLLNPNGHKIVIDEACMFWRKNIRDNDENGYITPAFSSNNAPDGVDPNRNYGFEWGYSGSSSDMNHSMYNGPQAWSEPEITAMKNLLESHQFVAGLTYHSYGEFICSPYSYSKSIITPDHKALEELMDDLAALSGYTPYTGVEMSPAMGCTEDYVYGTQGTFCYTVELADQFIPPAWEIESVFEQNIDAALLLLNRVNYSTLTGHITDSVTRQPVQAEIFIEGIDNIGEYRHPYMSNEMYGTYYRLLTDNDYNVTIKAYGYVPQSFENININNSEVTILDVSLSPESSIFNITGSVIDAESGLPIEDAIVEIINFDIPQAVTDQNGEYIISDIYPYSFEFRIKKNGYFVLFDQIEVSEENNILDFSLYKVESESFENGMFEAFWEFDGNTEWIIDNSIVYEGTYSAKSGYCSQDYYSVLEATLYLESDGEVSFFRKVSSEFNSDFFRFQIDDILQGEWSGILDWQIFSYPIPAGTHALKWSYIKDGSINVGSDCAWIDEVIFETTDIQENKLPGITVLHQNRPNPFNPAGAGRSPETTISYQLPGISKVKLSIYNIKGQLVKILVNEAKTTGTHAVIWKGRDQNNSSVASGIYFYILDTGTDKITRKMVLLK